MNVFRSVEASSEGDDQQFEALLLKKVKLHAGLKRMLNFRWIQAYEINRP
jgi:hypothetical protein